MSKQLLIVEESLKDYKGHWFEYIKTIHDQAKSMGWTIDVACHASVIEKIKNDLPTAPIFKKAYYKDQKKRTFFSHYFGFIFHNILVFRALWPLFSNKEKYDVAFVPTTNLHHIISWWIIQKFHPKKPKKLILLFLFSPAIYNSASQSELLPKSSKIYGFFLSLFKNLNNVIPCVQTLEAKKQFEKICMLNFRIISQPVLDITVPTTNEKKLDTKSELIFGTFGFSRYEKGSDLALKAIEKFLKSDDKVNAKFIIQWPDSFDLPDGLVCSMSDYLLNHSTVDIIAKTTTTSEYVFNLNKTDCILLPYRNSSYFSRDSRVAIEAAILGIPMIYTLGGWIEGFVNEYGAGIGIRDENTEDISSAIWEMINNYPIYKEIALSKKEKTKRHYSAEYFCKTLLTY